MMVGPSPCYINDGDGYVGGFSRADIDALLDTLEVQLSRLVELDGAGHHGRARPAGLGVELTNSFCRTDPTSPSNSHASPSCPTTASMSPWLKTPTLIIQSTEDIIAPRRGRRIPARGICPTATLRIVDNVGHCPHLSAPSATADAMDEFLAANAL